MEETKASECQNDEFLDLLNQWLCPILARAFSADERTCQVFVACHRDELENYFTTQNQSFVTISCVRIWKSGLADDKADAVKITENAEEAEDAEALKVSSQMLAQAKAKLKTKRKNKTHAKRSKEIVENVNDDIKIKPIRPKVKNRNIKIKLPEPEPAKVEEVQKETEALANDLAESLQIEPEIQNQYHSIINFQMTINSFPPEEAIKCCFLVPTVACLHFASVNLAWLNANFIVKTFSSAHIFPVLEKCFSQLFEENSPSKLEIVSECCLLENNQFEYLKSFICSTLCEFGLEVQDVLRLDIPDDLAPLIQLEPEKMTSEMQEQWKNLIEQRRTNANAMLKNVSSTASVLSEFLQILQQNFFLHTFLQNTVDVDELIFLLSFYNLRYCFRFDSLDAIETEKHDALEKVTIFRALFKTVESSEPLATSLLLCIDNTLQKASVLRFGCSYFRTTTPSRVTSDLNQMARIYSLWSRSLKGLVTLEGEGGGRVAKTSQMIANLFEEIGRLRLLLDDVMWDMLRERKLHVNAVQAVARASDCFLGAQIDCLHPINEAPVERLVQDTWGLLGRANDALMDLLRHSHTDAGIAQPLYAQFLAKHKL